MANKGYLPGMLYHIASKIYGMIAAPGNLLVILLVAGVILMWTPWRRAGRIMTVTAAGLFVAIAVIPWSSVLIGPLENRFPQPPELPRDIGGVIVLGGSASPWLSRARNQVILNENAERLTSFAVLAKHYGNSHLIFSGGSGRLITGADREADFAKRLLADLDVDVSRVVFERESRNTWENAVYASKLVPFQSAEKWLLVTSARHMPRAMGAFRKSGWNVTAYPVDYRTAGKVSIRPRFNFFAGLKGLRDGLHEWVGLVVYRALDRSDSLFPAHTPLQ